MTRQEIILRLKEISQGGYIRNARPGNAGGVGNTLEDLLEIPENNIPLTDVGEYEIKAKRDGDKSLTTLFHFEPEPREYRFVPQIFLPIYGWDLESIPGERSFRCTMHGNRYMDRGFKIVVDRYQEKVLVHFDIKITDPRHKDWLDAIIESTGGGEMDPQPYWTFESLLKKCANKLRNAFFLLADVKRHKGVEYYHYRQIWILENLRSEKFIEGLEEGKIVVDFDARTHHNHGTKFRFPRLDDFFFMYDNVEKLNPISSIG